MKLDVIFYRLWKDYINQNPSAGKIYSLFIEEGENVINDHIAFRTLDYPEINIDAVAKSFIKNGYTAKGEYILKRSISLPDILNCPEIMQHHAYL